MCTTTAVVGRAGGEPGAVISEGPGAPQRRGTGSECTVVLMYMLMNCAHLPTNQTFLYNTNTCGQKILLIFSQLVHHQTMHGVSSYTPWATQGSTCIQPVQCTPMLQTSRLGEVE